MAGLKCLWGNRHDPLLLIYDFREKCLQAECTGAPLAAMLMSHSEQGEEEDAGWGASRSDSISALIIGFILQQHRGADAVAHDAGMRGGGWPGRQARCRCACAQFGRQIGPLGQGKVLGLLEALVEGLELQARPHLPVLDHRCGLLVICGGEEEEEEDEVEEEVEGEEQSGIIRMLFGRWDEGLGFGGGGMRPDRCGKPQVRYRLLLVDSRTAYAGPELISRP
ncbi:hypothetical protein EYF80_031521 [Liparis tanakae]|uniref:Uncharacterized protein n=1 Tax=Liparis tanakae TaxID=230148 RepID=A0A4Z2GYB3_9TELE|nr:hypothetical protein EYF80_031521 [Liparis tanakae]